MNIRFIVFFIILFLILNLFILYTFFYSFFVTKNNFIEQERNITHLYETIHNITFEKKINSSLPYKKLIIGITTSYTEKSLKLRKAARETWLNYSTLWNGNWTYFFFLGQPAEDNAKIIPEELRYNDLIFLPNLDTYRNLSYKTMYMCKWMTEHYNFDFLLKMDDDVFVRLDKYVEVIKDIVPFKYWAGIQIPSYIPLREGKWGVSLEDFPYSSGPAWVHGFFYTMSYDCTYEVGIRSKNSSWPKIYLEDIFNKITL